MEQIATALLLWIAAQSSYPAAGLQPPPIVLVDAAALAALVQGPTGHDAQAPHGAAIWGHYRWDEGADGTIYVVHPEQTPGAARYATPSDNPLFRERLLHELVHFVQRKTGAYVRFHCRAEGERDAYRLGGKYLREQGVPDPLPQRKLLATMTSSC